jgi:hypothetical protein
MSTDVAVDNDVLHKLVMYDLLAAAQEALCTSGVPAVLGAARYVVGGLLERAEAGASADAVRAFKEFLDVAEELEPTDAELTLALELEERAQAAGAEVDGGESQLLAMATVRGIRMIATGDKRAIVGVESMRTSVAWLRDLDHRIACLEQVLTTLLDVLGVEDCRARVCSAKHVDKALNSCFACNGGRPDEEGVRAGLSSYVQHLRSRAPNVLKPGERA